MNSIRTLTHPDGSRRFKMGRTRPIARGMRLNFGDFRVTGLPPRPKTVNYFDKANASIRNIYCNDELGDCVIAWGYHALGVFTGNADGGTPILVSQEQVKKMYGFVGGYNGDPSTDNGCDEQTALNYWTQHGLLPGWPAEHKLVAWLALNPNDIEEVCEAVWLFENAMYGIEMPDEWITPMPTSDGFVWDVAGDPDETLGHCFGSCSYAEDNKLGIATWGMEGFITPKAVEVYCGPQSHGEIYTMITKDILNRATQKAPNGFDWDKLESFMKLWHN